MIGPENCKYHAIERKKHKHGSSGRIRNYQIGITENNCSVCMVKLSSLYKNKGNIIRSKYYAKKAAENNHSRGFYYLANFTNDKKEQDKYVLEATKLYYPWGYYNMAFYYSHKKYFDIEKVEYYIDKLIYFSYSYYIYNIINKLYLSLKFSNCDCENLLEKYFKIGVDMDITELNIVYCKYLLYKKKYEDFWDVMENLKDQVKALEYETDNSKNANYYIIKDFNKMISIEFTRYDFPSRYDYLIKCMIFFSFLTRPQYKCFMSKYIRYVRIKSLEIPFILDIKLNIPFGICNRCKLEGYLCPYICGCIEICSACFNNYYFKEIKYCSEGHEQYFIKKEISIKKWRDIKTTKILENFSNKSDDEVFNSIGFKSGLVKNIDFQKKCFTDDEFIIIYKILKKRLEYIPLKKMQTLILSKNNINLLIKRLEREFVNDLLINNKSNNNYKN